MSLVPRPRNIDWQVWKQQDGFANDQVVQCILMDIRDELQKLNRVFACSNFLGIPSVLQGILSTSREVQKNTKKKKPIRKKK